MVFPVEIGRDGQIRTGERFSDAYGSWLLTRGGITAIMKKSGLDRATAREASKAAAIFFIRR